MADDAPYVCDWFPVNGYTAPLPLCMCVLVLQ